MIVGTTLGDACLERNKPTHNTRIRFEQSYPAHEDYLCSIYSIFQGLTGNKGSPRVTTRKPDIRTGKVYYYIALKTRALPAFNIYFDLFYNYDKFGKRRKVVPINIAELLTPRAFAYRIIDDGGINAYNATQINTDSFEFDLGGVHILQEALLRNFELRTRLVEKRPNQWIIVIPVKQPVRLGVIVGEYMHPSMYYKVKKLTLYKFRGKASGFLHIF